MEEKPIEQGITTPARKSALDIPFSAMLKSANEKAGQERGLPAGATMKETLPAYYRTVKMVGDHPDAIGFSVYEHKKMNAEDGSEHNTNLPKPIRKGSLEYVAKSSIRDLIEGEHIAKMIMEPGSRGPINVYEPKNKALLTQFDTGRFANEQEARNAAAMQEFRNGRMDPSVTTPAGKQTIPDIDITDYFYQQNSKPDVVMDEGSPDSVAERRVKPAKPAKTSEGVVEDYGTREPLISEEEDISVSPVEGTTPEDRIQDANLENLKRWELKTREAKENNDEKGRPYRPEKKPKYKTEKKHTTVAASSEATPMEKSIPSFREMIGQPITKE